MEIVRKAAVTPHTLAVLAGSFNPPTCAHLGLAEAALAHADEVMFAVPRILPHKEFFAATLQQRVELLIAATSYQDRFSVGVAEGGGLLIDIARELRQHYSGSELLFICGRDAAERITGWQYESETIEDILREFGLLVAQREGTWNPPDHLSHAVTRLACGNYDAISSTAVREAITRGEPWEHLVPASIHDAIRRIY